MKRRGALAFLSAAALAPHLAHAQRKRRPRIGYFSLSSIRDPISPERRAFLEGLREYGFVAGKTVDIIYRSAENIPEFLSEMFADLIKTRVDLVVAVSALAVLAAKKGTTNVPIVMSLPGDPVTLGLVKSLARPGENITGVTALSTELAPKRMQLLREVLPSGRRVAIIWHDPNAQARTEAEAAIAAARNMGWTADRYPVASEQEIQPALARMAAARTHGLYVVMEVMILGYSATIAEFGLRNRVAVVSGYGGLTEAGALLSYSTNIPAMFRRLGYYVHRILGGTKPADLPIEQASTFEMIVNLKTARALKLSLPQEILLLADRVID